MTLTKGAIWIAFGNPSLREAMKAIQEYQAILPSATAAPVALICEAMTPLRNVQHVIREDISWGARQTKVMLDLITPYNHTLYMDADTRVKSSAILRGFKMLEAGWDLIMAPSHRQGSDVFGHIDQEERIYTFNRLSNIQAIQFQAGVMWFSNSTQVASLFDAWREEWNVFKRHDQAALARAIDRVPIKIWVLGSDWNGRRGTIVDHLFGRAII
jgi:hypothetical protein